jgi:endonuclease/exonuclease/phosphatase family metal-dependent hydrolase
MNRRFFLAACLCLGGLLSVDAGDNDRSVKVMSFNIRYATAPDGDNAWPKRKGFLAETIKTFNPDFLGTQETLAVQRDFLAEQFPTHAVVAAGRDDGKEKGEMAALYFRKDRFEKLAGGHFWLSENPERVGVKGWDAALPRIATWVKLRDLKNASQKPILYMNVHFDHQGKKARAESGKLMRDRIDSLGAGCSLILTGDFNSDEDSGAYQALFGKRDDRDSSLVDTFRVVHPKREKNEGTFNGFKANAVTGPRIDWIGCSRDWKVTSAAIDRVSRDGRYPSDHFPITAELTR